jgi:protein-S-isoprenylcysteine O-methyltransferase Ste14
MGDVYAAGLLAFALFFLSDANDWRLSRPWLKGCFPVGALVLAWATWTGARRGTAPISGAARAAAGVLGAAFFVLLLYTLFFALPVRASYAEPGAARPVCTQGVYALCRHPGVLWFAGLYLCLWGAAGLPPGAAVLFSALNVLLVVFEDRRVFPARLTGYEAYRRTTPFLIPTRASIRACLRGR